MLFRNIHTGNVVVTNDADLIREYRADCNYKRMDDFNEADHPRDEDGKFTSGGGSAAAVAAPVEKRRPKDMSVEEKRAYNREKSARSAANMSKEKRLKRLEQKRQSEKKRSSNMTEEQKSNLAQYQKQYQIKNKEKLNEYKKEYSKKNSTKAIERVKKYVEKNKNNPNFKAALNLKSRNRKLAKIQRTASWANAEKIAEAYIEAARLTRETGIPHEVDHIIPLRGKNVSGLHVEQNLRVIPRSENRSKSAKFSIEDSQK